MAIAGGIYYLIARPKITFIQAMFSKWIVLFGATIFTVRILQIIASRLSTLNT